MRNEEFQKWLIEVKGKDSHQACDNASRIRRVEKGFSAIRQREVDLDDECIKDHCESLIDDLCIAKRKEMPKTVNLPNNTEGLSQLRSSVRNYVAFFLDQSNNI